MIIDNVNKQYEPEGNLSEPVVPQSVPLIYNGKPSNTKQYVHQYLLNKGLPNHISKGIVGNLEQESNLKTNAINSKSGAYGLAQWLGDRKKNLFKTYGNNPTLENQLDYIVKELNTTEKKAKDKLFESKDVDEATLNFANHYERMGKNEANYKKRISNARSIYKYGGVLKKYDLGGTFDYSSVPYDSIGQLSSNLVDSTQSKKARDYKKVSTGTWSGVLSGMGSGASIGSSAGLIGTIAGGVIGGIVGGVSGNKKAKEYNENLNNEFKNENQMFLQNAGVRSRYVLNQYPTKGIDSFYRYKRGGKLNPQYEVEKGEVVQGDANLEESKELAKGLHYVKGKTHEEGGVKGEGGDRVFSNSLGISKESFADMAKKIANKISKVEKNDSKSAITRQTSKINLQKLHQELDNVFNIQEMMKPKYKYGGYLPSFDKGGTIKTSKVMADDKLIRERLAAIDNELKGTFSNPDIKDGLLRESKSLKLRLANVQRQLSSRLNNMSDNSMRNIKASSGNKPSTTIPQSGNKPSTTIPQSGNKPSTTIPQSGKENLKQNAKTITNIASNVSKFGNYLKGFAGLSVINEAAQKGAKEVTLSNMMFDNSEIGKKYQQQFSKLNHFQNNDDTVNKIIEDYKNEVKMSSNKKPVKTQERVPSNPIDLTPNRNDIKPSKPLTTTQKYKTVKLQSKAPVLKTPELPKRTEPILPAIVTNINKTSEKTDNPFEMERDNNGIPTISKSYMDSISSNSQPAASVTKEPKQGFDFSKITPYVASVANYLGNKNMINSLQEEVPVNLNQATPYNYYDRSNMIRTQLGKSFSSLMTNPYISQGNKQNMYANYLDKLGEVEDNERLGKLQYDANYAYRNYQVEASNNATLQNAKAQQITNKNQKIGLHYQNTNDLYGDINTGVSEQNARKRDEQTLKVHADANPNTGHAYYNYLKKLYNIS